MVQYIDKSAVVAEIERRIEENKADIQRATHKHLEEYFEGYEDALVLFKEKFLGTLEVKEIGVDFGDPEGDIGAKTVWTDLEEAANSCSSCIYLEEVLSDGDKEVLKERLINTFKAGAQWQKEQMMKETVYGLVCGHDESSPAWIDLNLLNKPNVKVGTEVKLIIIKDEQL